MYGFMLLVHSWMRWLVLILAAMAVLRAITGMSGGRHWRDADDRGSLFLSIAIDVQFVVGLVLYLVLSPTTKMAFADMAVAMRTSALRYWAVEHVSMMLLALVFVHVGRVSIRRAVESASKHRRAAIYFGLALLLVIAGTPWPMMPNGRPWLRIG